MAAKDTKSPETNGGGSERRLVVLSVRLDGDTHYDLRRIAFDRRVSIHSLMLEAIAFVRQKYKGTEA
jgi:hypothetical protein